MHTNFFPLEHSNTEYIVTSEIQFLGKPEVGMVHAVVISIYNALVNLGEH